MTNCTNHLSHIPQHTIKNRHVKDDVLWDMSNRIEGFVRSVNFRPQRRGVPVSSGRLPDHPSVPWKGHQMETFSALLAIYGWNSPVPGEFPAQRPVTRSFDVFCAWICAWINGWVNHHEAGDLGCHRAYYDVIVMDDDYDNCNAQWRSACSRVPALPCIPELACNICPSHRM